MTDANWNMTDVLPTLTPTIIVNGDPDATLEIKFNTGREYTAEGQVIFAKVKAGMVYFVDTARGMDGRFNPNGEVDDASQLMRAVMRAYDFRAAMRAYDFNDYESAAASYKYAREVAAKDYGEGVRVTGWMEGENGVLSIDVTGRTYADCWQACVEDYGTDFGHTDMELEDQDGRDVTLKAYNWRD